MAKKISKKALKWTLAVVGVAVVALIGFQYWKAKKSALPEGIISGNGRLEAKLVDVSAKEPLRVKEVLVNEGDDVKPGQLLVQLDTVTLQAELAEAKASVAAAQEHLAVARASIVKQQHQVSLAETEAARSKNLVQQRAGSQRELDVRNTTTETAKATQSEAEAMLQTAKQQVEVARATVATIQTRIEDATLESPVTGRVLYRLAEPGEVLAPGGKAITLVNLEDIYMEIFVPSEDAARMKIGAEGRIVVDYDPDHAMAGRVSFVSPEAQFTPKQVETRSEREKLMFRVKIQLPKELASDYLNRIKTGVRGIGYVKTDPAAVWPKKLQNLVSPQPQPGEQKPQAPPRPQAAAR
jgi:HlyD family secretion protein